MASKAEGKAVKEKAVVPPAPISTPASVRPQSIACGVNRDPNGVDSFDVERYIMRGVPRKREAVADTKRDAKATTAPAAAASVERPAAVWNSDEMNLIAWGGGSLLCIGNVEAGICVAALRGHSARVNAVRFLYSRVTPASKYSELELVSASSDGVILVWKFNPHTFQYSCTAALRAHTESVTAICCFSHSSTAGDIIVSTSADSTTRVWRRTAVAAAASDAVFNDRTALGAWECSQVIDNPKRAIFQSLDITLHAAHDSASASAPDSKADADANVLLLAAAGVDTKVHMFVEHSQPAAVGSSGAATRAFVWALGLEGHTDWVRSLHFAQTDYTPVPSTATGTAATPQYATYTLLASASQDRTIRLWKFSFGSSPAVMGLNAVATDANSMAVTTTSLGQKGHIVKVAGVQLMVVLDSLLFGHEDWVMRAMWHPPTLVPIAPGSDKLAVHQPLSLVSASTDHTMLVWRYDPTHRLYQNDVRVGEMGGTRLGFYGCTFVGPRSDPSSGGGVTRMLAHGYTGSWHLWRNPTPDRADTQWLPALAPSGHAGPVMDATWDSANEYVLSTSTDQTTRLFAPWNVPFTPADQKAAAAAAAASSNIPYPRWCEIARPQIHGYDMNCMTSLNGIRHRFASGADEKVVRVFFAPVPFLESLQHISGLSTLDDAKYQPAAASAPPSTAVTATTSASAKPASAAAAAAGVGAYAAITAKAAAMAAAESNSGPSFLLSAGHLTTSRAMRANLPELGLSNKPILAGDTSMRRTGFMPIASSDQRATEEARVRGATAPPTDDWLVSHSLWPEVDKLYGHGYELMSMTADYAGGLIATACVAKSETFAVIRIWETKEWKPACAPLIAHSSTVIQMEFSHSDEYLVCVSKDRHFSVFQRFALPTNAAPATSGGASAPSYCVGFRCVSYVKAHTRLIWGISWSGCDTYFATASRDRKCKVWRLGAKGEKSKYDKSDKKSAAPRKGGAASVRIHPKDYPGAEPEVDEEEDASRLSLVSPAMRAIEKEPLQNWLQDSTLATCEKPVTAVAWLSTKHKNEHLVCLGLEDGILELYQTARRPTVVATDPTVTATATAAAGLKWTCLIRFDPLICHASAVRRIRWRQHKRLPTNTEAAAAASTAVTTATNSTPGSFVYDLLTCSTDHSVRVFGLNI